MGGGNLQDDMSSSASVEHELSSLNPIHRTVRLNPSKATISGRKPRNTPALNVPSFATAPVGLRKPSSSLLRVSKNVGMISPHTQKNLTPARAPKHSDTAKHLGVSSAKKGTPATPHAVRALEQKKIAALTPAFNRRKSGPMHRDTPRETLRHLSKILARTSRVIEPSTAVNQARIESSKDDELEDGLHLLKSRLLMPIANEDEDEDSFQMRSPRNSILLDDRSHAERSIELGRHIVSQQPPGRLSRGSFGNVRMSDRFADPDDQEPRMWNKRPSVSADESGLEVLPTTMDVDNDTQNLEDPELARRTRRSSSSSVTRGEQFREPSGDISFTFKIPARAAKEASTPILARDDILESDGNEERHLAKKVQSTSINRARGRQLKPKAQKISRYGISYPSLSSAVIRKLMSVLVRQTGSSKRTISKDSFGAVVEATDWFFEQISDDVATFARHGGRKTIDESDMVTLMKRQRQLKATATPFSIAQGRLPRELIQRIRMVAVTRSRIGQKAPIESPDKEDFEMMTE